MPVNNNRNQGVDSTEVIENYGKITGGAHNFGKIADSVISLSLSLNGSPRLTCNNNDKLGVNNKLCA